MTLESVLLFLVGALAVGAFVSAWFRPSSSEKQYGRQLAQVEAKLTELEGKLQKANQQVEKLRAEYQSLATEYLRIVGENHWLRSQLRAQNIEIAPLPDDLKPHQDESGNIVISVRQGGVDMNDHSSISAARDFVAGDLKHTKS